MNKKVLGTILFLLITVVIGAGLYYMFFGFGEEVVTEPLAVVEEEEVEEQEGTVIIPTKNARPTIIIDGKDITKELVSNNETKIIRQFGKDDLMRLAASFSERYGSFSNHSNYGNIIDLKIFMSQKMVRWADSYVNERRKKSPTDEIYYGITTRSIAQEITTYDDDVGRASVTVSTRRREAAGSTTNISNVFDQDILVSFIKEKNIWKVDSATWKDR